MKKIFLSLTLVSLLLVSCSNNNITTTNMNEENNLEVTYLNVGKADAIVLKYQDSYTLIDTGLEETSNILINSLNNMGCKNIDYLIISHFDKDHVGGASYLLDNFSVSKIYTTYKSSDSNTNSYNSFINKITELNYNDILTVVDTLTEFKIDNINYVIYPASGDDCYTNDLSNNSSLLVKTTYDNRSFLFTGDAEKQRIKEIIKYDISCDVLKIPHHGGIEDNSDKLISEANPTYSIITSSIDEPEDQELVDLLYEYGSEVYFTRNGDIKVTTDGDNIKIEQ